MQLKKKKKIVIFLFFKKTSREKRNNFNAVGKISQQNFNALKKNQKVKKEGVLNNE